MFCIVSLKGHTTLINSFVLRLKPLEVDIMQCYSFSWLNIVRSSLCHIFPANQIFSAPQEPSQ